MNGERHGELYTAERSYAYESERWGQTTRLCEWRPSI